MRHPARLPMLYVLLTCLGFASSVFAALEFIPLRHTPPEDIIPMIQPFLADGESVVAGRNELIVKAGPKSMQSIRQIVAKYDTPLQQLLIYVRVKDGSEKQQQRLDGQLNAQIHSDASSSVHGQVRLYQKHSTNQRNQQQFIRVIEGRPAYISYGTSTPVPGVAIYSSPPTWTLSQQTEYHDDTEGFIVTPRLVGEQVLLDIDQWSSQRGHHHQGSPHSVSKASSSIRMSLDQWVTLGGIQESTNQDQQRLLGKNSRSRDQHRTIEVKIVRSDPNR